MESENSLDRRILTSPSSSTKEIVKRESLLMEPKAVSHAIVACVVVR